MELACSAIMCLQLIVSPRTIHHCSLLVLKLASFCEGCICQWHLAFIYIVYLIIYDVSVKDAYTNGIWHLFLLFI